MAERTLYTCDLCRKETTSAIPKGVLFYQVMVSSLNFHTKKSPIPTQLHTCNACLDIITRELDAKFDEVISKLLQDLIG